MHEAGISATRTHNPAHYRDRVALNYMADEKNYTGILYYDSKYIPIYRLALKYMNNEKNKKIRTINITGVHSK